MSDWTLDKKIAFTKAMGKRQKFSKGGRIRKLGKRKYFADGGDTTLGGPGNGGVNQNDADPNTGFLGNINAALGLNNNFAASAADIQPGTNAAQLNNAYTGAQGALGNQGALVNTLTPQAAQAVANQNSLADQYSAMTRGEGPNPARAQLNNATGANVANQAALMAGQRGAGANVGLMAREAARQGAGIQQQAVGQEAGLEAQQQLAAQEKLQNLSNNQISQTGQAITGQNSAAQNEQSLLQNANTSANNAKVGMQSNINNVNSQTAAANQNMASNTMGGLMSAASSLSSMFAKGGRVDEHIKLAEMNAHSLKHAKRYDDGGEVDLDSDSESEAPDLGSFKGSADSASAPNIGSTASLPGDQTDFSKAMQKPGGGGGGGGGGAGGMMQMLPMLAALAEGGAVPNLGSGNYHSDTASSGPSVPGTSSLPANHTDLSKAIPEKKKEPKKDKPKGDMVAGGPEDAMDRTPTMSPGADTAYDESQMAYAAKGGQMGHFHNYFSEGGKVPAMVSPGEIYLSPEKVSKVLHEGKNPMKIGEKIHGKAKVKGDSLKNDTVKRTLEEGGVVVPRHITTHKMAPEKAELFVRRAMARKKVRG